ncbi:hypothetical protein E1258_10210 [Micromonospora sp. KC207]|uniref:ATP synthase F0 subunit B n=1 Tax=Micromonospora sp. KC207 TaxID=2530377 RepID=UPI00104B5FEA|nr:ATP synthase F0 subunit B [Micromonospora sp. KC207]TDC63644.1 hypothetical protein E1258_10210 [Micromonospora sp. KC207]
MDGSQADPGRARPAGGEPVTAAAAIERAVLPPADPTGEPATDRSRRERALTRRVGRLRDHQARLEQELVDLRHATDARAAEVDRLRRDLGAALDRAEALAARLREFGDVTPEEFAARTRRQGQDLTAREGEIGRHADEAERLVAQARRQAAELLATARAEAGTRIERDRRDAHRQAEATAEKIVARAENRAEALLAEAELQLRRLRGESRSTIALPERPAFRSVRNGYVKGQADDAEFLVHGEPHAVAELLAARQVPWLTPDDVARLRRPTRSRRYALAVAALLGGAPEAADALCRPPGQPPLDWVPAWATPTTGEETVGLPAADVLVDAPAAATVLVRTREQRYVCVATTDGELTVWEATDLTPLWSARLDGSPRSLRRRGRLLIVEDGYGRAFGWEVVTGRPAMVDSPVAPPAAGDGGWASPPAPPDGVGPTAQVATESGPILLVADPRGGVRLLRHDGGQWIPAGWQPTRHPVTALAGVAAGPRLTIVRVDGGEVVVTSRNLRKEQRRAGPEHLLGRLPGDPAAPGRTRLTCTLAGRDLFVLAEGEWVQAWWLRPGGPAPAPPAAPAGDGHLVSSGAAARCRRCGRAAHGRAR